MEVEIKTWSQPTPINGVRLIARRTFPGTCTCGSQEIHGMFIVRGEEVLVCPGDEVLIADGQPVHVATPTKST